MSTKFTKALFLFATLLMISCSDDLYEHGDKKNESGYKITDKSLKELSSEKKFLKAFTELNASKSSNSKTVMEQNYNFTISDIPAKVIEKNGNTSYSFYIERDTTNYAYFENLIVGSDSLNQTKAYIAKYKKDFTKPSLINNVPFKSVSITPIIYNDNQSSKVIDCVTKVYSLCNGDFYDCGGAVCGFGSYTICKAWGGSLSNGTGVSWQGGGTATTPVGGGGGSASSNMDKFISSLGFNEQEWFGNQSSQTQQSVFNYLNTNGFTLINKNFIKQLISYLMQNSNLSFDDVFYNKTNFDSNNSKETNNYTIGGFDTNTYSVFNPQQNWSNISSVIPVSQFVGWGTPGINRNCMDYAKAQIAKKGYQISAYTAVGQTFQIYTSQNGVNTTQLIQGLSYLKYALSNNIPVVVGVDDAPSHPGNLDSTTDHFIVIVGMGHNSTGNYLQFYDNASGSSSQGASPLNLLYYNPTTGIISGSSQTSYGQGQPYPYILTMIRKSKLL